MTHMHMPQFLADDPDHWRARGDEMRAIAESMKHSASKAMMLQIAKDYDKLAELTEARSGKRRTDK